MGKRSSSLVVVLLAAACGCGSRAPDPVAVRVAVEREKEAAAHALAAAVPVLSSSCARLRSGADLRGDRLSFAIGDAGVQAALEALDAAVASAGGSPGLDRAATRFARLSEALIARSRLPGDVSSGSLLDQPTAAESVRRALLASCEAALDAGAALRGELEPGAVAHQQETLRERSGLRP